MVSVSESETVLFQVAVYETAQRLAVHPLAFRNSLAKHRRDNGALRDAHFLLVQTVADLDDVLLHVFSKELQDVFSILFAVEHVVDQHCLG
jgi:hypothetical protein